MPEHSGRGAKLTGPGKSRARFTKKGGRGVPNRRNLAKTTRKGAYNPGRKANFQKRRAPFVETKKQTDVVVALKAGVGSGETLDTLRRTTEALEISNGTFGGSANTLTVFPINSFTQMNKGLEASDMIGNSVYSRYLKCKIEIGLPFGSKCIKHPCDLYLIHGWITQPIGNTIHTNPTVLDTTRTLVNEHIQEQLLQYFNQRLDKLQFIPRKQSNIKIEGYRKVKPKLNNSLGAPAVALQYNNGMGGTVVTSDGSPPVVNMVCSWNTKRKIDYSLGKDELQGTPLAHNFPNYAWLPFMALYNPTASEFLAAPYQAQNEPKFNVRYNSAHYFSDS